MWNGAFPSYARCALMALTFPAVVRIQRLPSATELLALKSTFSACETRSLKMLSIQAPFPSALSFAPDIAITSTNTPDSYPKPYKRPASRVASTQKLTSGVFKMLLNRDFLLSMYIDQP